MRRFVEHDDHVDIEENFSGIWAVTKCNMVMIKTPPAAKLEKTEKDKVRLEHKKTTRYKNYNITKQEFEEMKAKQNGMCAICGRENNNLVIDHNHKTGKVRGLLCTACNVGIGLLQDSVDILTIAIKYITKN